MNRTSKYIFLIKLELPIKIDCGDYFICPRIPFAVDVFYHIQYKCLSINISHLNIIGLSDSLESLLQEIEYDIRMLWRIYVREEREQTSDAKKLSNKLQQSFLEVEKEK